MAVLDPIKVHIVNFPDKVCNRLSFFALHCSFSANPFSLKLIKLVAEISSSTYVFGFVLILAHNTCKTVPFALICIWVLSLGALGVMGCSCDSLLTLLKDLNFDNVTQRRIIMTTINIAIRSTYYIFCQRNKPWSNPELLNFWAFASSLTILPLSYVIYPLSLLLFCFVNSSA